MVMDKIEKKKDEYAIVLDISNENQNFQNVLAIGCSTFSLLKLVLKKDSSVTILEKLYIGDGVRDKVQFIKEKVGYNKVNNSVKIELEDAIKTIVENNEKKYVNFLNTCGAISIRSHSLELIPNIGKKNLNELIDLREEKPFTNFQDLKERFSKIKDPILSLSKRILKEIEDENEINFLINI